MRFSPPLSTPHRDAGTEEIRRNVDQRLREVTDLPASGMVVIRDVVLPDGALVPVSHGLGRRPRWIGVSAIRFPSGATPSHGVVFDFGDVGAGAGGTGAIDRTRIVVLRGFGFASTVIVDLAVM